MGVCENIFTVSMNNIDRLANRAIKCMKSFHGGAVIYRYRCHNSAFSIARK